MPADRAHSPTSNSPPSPRRPSLTPGSFGDLFSKPNNSYNMSNSTGNSSFPNPIATAAAANAQSNRRRMSITTLGLSGSPTQTSPFSSRAAAGRRESLSSSESYEDAIDDNDSSPANNPTSPFARRVSFGAQALRDVRGGNGNGNGNGRYPSSGSSPLATSRYSASSTSSTYTRDNPPSSSSLSSSSPSSTTAGTSTNKLKIERSDRSWRPLGEGFNWSAALRTRAERAPSIGGSFPASAQPQPLMSQNDLNNSPQSYHQRAASIAIMEQPTRDIPKEPRQKKPDFFQEKILRADFMD